jgi:hypothetical protein
MLVHDAHRYDLISIIKCIDPINLHEITVSQRRRQCVKVCIAKPPIKFYYSVTNPNTNKYKISSLFDAPVSSRSIIIHCIPFMLTPSC